MIETYKINELVGDYIPSYVYNKEFNPGVDQIYYSGPYWDDKEIKAAIETFLNGRWIVAGHKVAQFERSFSKKFNTKYSHMVNSGSSANLVMIAALKKRYGWKDGDEIIVSPVGFATTISVLVQNNLTPVFIDIEWNTLNFDLNKIREKINRKTKAIFLSPVLGNPPNMVQLKNICIAYDLELILDNCDSLGSKWEGKYLGEYAVAFSNSFYPAHHISTGEGGMICTNDKELKKLLVSISWWGRDCYCVGQANLLSCGTCGRRFDNWLENYDGIIDHKYVFTNMGYNLKPLDLQGAIGIEQLKKFEEIETNRKISKNTIEKLFTDNIPGLKAVKSFDDADVSWFGTPFICEEPGLKHRLVEYLEKNNIQTRNYFAGNILMHPGFEHLDDYKNYPEANKVLDKVFFVGASPHYRKNTFEYIETIVKNFK